MNIIRAGVLLGACLAGCAQPLPADSGSGSSEPSADELVAVAEMRLTVAHHLELAHQMSPEAQHEYAHSLRELRTSPDVASLAAAELYRETEPQEALRRWSLVHLVSTLGSDAGAVFLADVAATPLPERGGHDNEQWASESFLRGAALEGLADMARSGTAIPVESIEPCLDSESNHVKRLAVAAILAQDPGAETRLIERLSERDRWMLHPRTGNFETDGQITAPARPSSRRRTPYPVLPALNLEH